MNIYKALLISAAVHIAAIAVSIGMLVYSEEMIIHFNLKHGISSLHIEMRHHEAFSRDHRDDRERGDAADQTLLVQVAHDVEYAVSERHRSEKNHHTVNAQSEEHIGAFYRKADENSLNHPPEFPYLARKLGYQGNVLLSIEVLPSGKAGEVAVLRSSGYDVLDNAAVSAAEKWTFFDIGEIQLQNSVYINKEIAFIVQ